MSVVYRPAISASVFVTTRNIAAKEGDNIVTGEWFELLDYEDKPSFIRAALAYVTNELGEEDPILHFPDFNAGFDTEGLISQRSISAETWDMLSLEDFEVEMLQAYRELYPQPEGVSLLDTLAKAQSQYIGYFNEAEDFAVSFLENGEHISSFPALIGYIDLPRLAVHLMEGKKEVGGHYFSNQTSKAGSLA